MISPAYAISLVCFATLAIGCLLVAMDHRTSNRRAQAAIIVYVIGFALSFVSVALGSSPDLDNDLDVDGADIGLIIGAWGTTDPNHPCDLNGDSKVDGSDLGIALGAWSGPGVLWQPVTIDGDRRLSNRVPITAPTGAKVEDAEDYYGPLWRDICMFSWTDENGLPVFVFETPEGWIEEDRVRAASLKDTTP